MVHGTRLSKPGLKMIDLIRLIFFKIFKKRITWVIKTQSKIHNGMRYK